MRSGTATVSELIAHGGWLLDDPQRIHAENPDTFEVPEIKHLDAVQPGHMVRLIFELADHADPALDGVAAYHTNGSPQLVVNHERMWLWVENRHGDGHDAELLGILHNMPWSTHTRLQPGARVRFRARDIIEIDFEPAAKMSVELESLTSIGFSLQSVEASIAPEDPNRPPSIAPSQTNICERVGVRPERPSLFMSRLIVSKNLTETSTDVFGARFRTDADRRDNGWMIWADHEDMGDPAIGDFEAVDAAELQRRHPEAWKYLALPPGWSFALRKNGDEDIFEDPELLVD